MEAVNDENQMTDYCKRVLAGFDEASAQLRRSLQHELALDESLEDDDGGGLSHATKLDKGRPVLMVSFAWGETAGHFAEAIQLFFQEHEKHAVKDKLQ